MSYDDLRQYIDNLLKRSRTTTEFQIDPTAIDASRIRSVDHSQFAGLQAADAVASALHFAGKRNIYWEVEPAYLPYLAKNLYRHNNNPIGYGLKFWPGNLDNIGREVPEVYRFGDL